jgi:hypothetical protein
MSFNVQLQPTDNNQSVVVDAVIDLNTHDDDGNDGNDLGSVLEVQPNKQIRQSVEDTVRVIFKSLSNLY